MWYAIFCVMAPYKLEFDKTKSEKTPLLCV